jgi:hypothetical protein
MAGLAWPSSSGAKLVRCAFVAVVCAVIVAVSVAGPGCDDSVDQKPVLGRDGKQRFVVTFEDKAPDLAEYRKLLQDGDGEAVTAYVTKMRARQAQAHPELDKSLAALEGAVVERWWMSNQVTVEMPPSALASVKTVAGVKDVAPDALLGP